METGSAGEDVKSCFPLFLNVARRIFGKSEKQSA